MYDYMIIIFFFLLLLSTTPSTPSFYYFLSLYLSLPLYLSTNLLHHFIESFGLSTSADTVSSLIILLSISSLLFPSLLSSLSILSHFPGYMHFDMIDLSKGFPSSNEALCTNSHGMNSFSPLYHSSLYLLIRSVIRDMFPFSSSIPLSPISISSSLPLFLSSIHLYPSTLLPSPTSTTSIYHSNIAGIYNTHGPIGPATRANSGDIVIMEANLRSNDPSHRTLHWFVKGEQQKIFIKGVPEHVQFAVWLYSLPSTLNFIFIRFLFTTKVILLNLSNLKTYKSPKPALSLVKMKPPGSSSL